MAKAKAAATKGTTETTTGNEAAPATPKVKREVNIRYTYVKDPTEGAKFAPQCVLVIEHIRNAGADGISRADLCKALSADERFKTKQPVERIVSYYQNDMVNAGCVSITK